MMTSSGIFASIASMTASFVKAGGTNAMEVSAPVTAIASATVANTGSSTGRPFLSVWETVVPALRALTPPTTCVPAASIRAVCLEPSPPVMPWTMTLESLLRKIVMCSVPVLSSFRCGGVRVTRHSPVGQLCRHPGPYRRLATQAGVPPRVGCGGLRPHCCRRGGQQAACLPGARRPPPHPPTHFGPPVAVEADNKRLVRRGPEFRKRADDPVCDRVTGRDATKHVDEHTLYLRVAENDRESIRHDRSGCSDTDVEEVRRFHTAVTLARVGDDIKR